MKNKTFLTSNRTINYKISKSFDNFTLDNFTLGNFILGNRNFSGVGALYKEVPIDNNENMTPQEKELEMIEEIDYELINEKKELDIRYNVDTSERERVEKEKRFLHPLDRGPQDYEQGLITEEIFERHRKDMELYYKKIKKYTKEVKEVEIKKEDEVNSQNTDIESNIKEVKNESDHLTIDNRLLKPIKTKYKYDLKNKPIFIGFNIWELQEPDIMIERLTKKLLIGEVYTVFVKVRYSLDHFFMAGNQFGFSYDSSHNLTEVYEIVSDKLDLYMENYNLLNQDIVYIELSFRKKDKRLLSEFILDKKDIPHVDKKDIDKDKKLLNIPVSISEDSLGKPLKTEVSNDFITNIILEYESKVINFLDLIKKKSSYIRDKHIDNISFFDSNYKFYLIKDETKNPFILAIKVIDQKSVDKIRYTLSGVVINRIKDILCDGYIKRISGEKIIIIKEDKIVKVEENILLKHIPKPKNEQSRVEDNNIGVIDTETYKALDGTVKIYALGFKTILDPEPVMFYINKETMDHNELVLNLINELLRSKYNKIRFYCHNLAGYDIVFILKIIYLFNENTTEEKYKVSLTLKDNRILKCVISRDKQKLTLIDSYPILPKKLSELGKDFNVETMKSIFPYEFSLQDNLFYVGPTPTINYYNDISKSDYNKIFKVNWSFEEETLKYLKDDLLCLFEVMINVNKRVFLDYDTDLKDSLTISSLAARIYFKKYYNNNIPVIAKASLYKDIKQAYYGGITEVYKPYGENLYYYDVNSLYPFVAHQPMPGLSCVKLTFYEPTQEIDNLFGFFYCRVKTPTNGYLGLLPVRTRNGLNFPLGIWEGWYFSEEIKFARDNGYEITILNGYNFSKEYSVFDNYISDIYKFKSNPINKSQKSIAKSLLNNLLGRFGISLDKPVTEVVSDNEFDKISMRHKIMNYKNIAMDKIMVSYTEKLDYEIIKEHGLDFVKVLSKYKDKEIQSLNITSIVISAAITAYARIHITRLKLDIINKLGGNIYYSDTDSIVTDVKLPENMIHSSEIGKLKLEHVIKKGIFISGKLYSIITDSDIIIRSKGVNSKSLEYKDFMTLLLNKNIEHAMKTQSKTDWSVGQVKIFSEPITINSDNYTKRQKIFDTNGYWVDTKPNQINLIDKKLSIYRDIYKPNLYKPIKNKGSSEHDQKIVTSSFYKNLKYYTLLILLFPVSFIAYFIIHSNLDSDEFTSDIGIDLEVKEIFDDASYDLSDTVFKSKTVRDGILEDSESQAYVVRESVSDDSESKPYSNTELEKYNNITIDGKEYTKEDIPSIESNKKSLFQIFLERQSPVKDKDDNNSTVRPSTSDSAYTLRASSDSDNTSLPDTPIKDFDFSDRTSPKKELKVEVLYSDDNGKFSPRTLKELDQEIENNKKSLSDLDKVCQEDVKESVKEKLLEEQKYLLEQKTNHLESVLQDAKNIPTNDVDTDKLCQEINSLKERVTKLQEESRSINRIDKE